MPPKFYMYPLSPPGVQGTEGTRQLSGLVPVPGADGVDDVGGGDVAQIAVGDGQAGVSERVADDVDRGLLPGELGGVGVSEPVGVHAPFDAAFVGFTMAAIVTLLGAVPLGLGSFEATSIATLRLMGVPFEAALSATLLYRGFALWLPLALGAVLTRRAMRQ